MQLFFLGIGLGFLSSGHCLGMCGPIAFFLGTNQLKPDSPRIAKALLFITLGAGKALTYGWIGLIFGWAGHLLTEWSDWMGFARALPWISGFFFILSGAAVAGWIPKLEWKVRGMESRFQQLFQSFRKKHDTGSLFALGMLWGLLPCPMVLAPALGAAVSGSAKGLEGALQGFFMMAGFGLGTIPALYTSAMTGQWLNRLRRWSPLAVGLALMVLGISSMAAAYWMGASPGGHSCCH